MILGQQTHALNRHGESMHGVFSSISAQVERIGDSISIVYFFGFTKNTSQFDRVPQIRLGEALWNRTCFELFLQPATLQEYYEWNFAPDGAWSAYRLADYRSNISTDPDVQLTAATNRCGPSGGELHRTMQLAPGHRLLAVEPCQLAISAVDCECSRPAVYWALAHPPGQPDFHHPTCFTATLPPIRRGARFHSLPT